MSELKRMLPQLRLACLLTAMMLVTTAGGDLGSFYLTIVEPDCELPPDPVDFRLVPPLLFPAVALGESGKAESPTPMSLSDQYTPPTLTT